MSRSRKDIGLRMEDKKIYTSTAGTEIFEHSGIYLGRNGEVKVYITHWLTNSGYQDFTMLQVKIKHRYFTQFWSVSNISADALRVKAARFLNRVLTGKAKRREDCNVRATKLSEEELRTRRTEAVRRHRERNKEKIAQQRKAVYYSNVEKARAYGRSQYRKYHQKQLASSREYKKKNYDKVLAYSRKNSKTKSARERKELKDHYVVSLISKSLNMSTDEVRKNTELIAIHRTQVAIKRLQAEMLKRGFKVCKQCGKSKPISEFTKGGKSYKSRCNPCYGEHRKKYKK